MSTKNVSYDLIIDGHLTATSLIKAGGTSSQFLMGDGSVRTFGTSAGNIAEGNHTHTFASLTSKPTTLAGYGITDTPWTAYLPLTGGTLTGDVTFNTEIYQISSLIRTREQVKTIQNPINHYQPTSVVGAVAIKFPKGSNTMMDIDLLYQDYNTGYQGKYRLTAYWYGSYFHGNNTGVTLQCSNNYPSYFYNIRYANDATGNPILIFGDVGTTLPAYSTLIISEIRLRYSSYSNSIWDNGYSVTTGITDLSPYTINVSPTTEVSKAAVATHTHTEYLPLTGGTMSGSIISGLTNSVVGVVGINTPYRMYSSGNTQYGIGISTSGGIEYMSNQLAAGDSHKFYGGADNPTPKWLATIHGTGNMSLLGILNVSGGNSTNWNTAYGWGNHAGLYDNYVSWNLKTNGVQRTGMASGSSLDIVAGTNMSVSYSAGGVVTLASTNTWNANTQAAAGYVAAGGTNYNMVWATDGAGNPGWGSVPATAGATATHTQGTAATTWTFNHNLGQLFPAIVVYNASNQVVIPTTITAVSVTQATITFSSALAGTAVAVLGGTGATGADGLTPTLGVGTVTTGAPGTSVIITEGGTALARTFNFTIPRGDTGATYIHPAYTALNPTLSGALVLASLTTDAIGSVTAATTRTLTLANLGYTGATNANNYVHPAYTTRSITATGATVLSTFTSDAIGSVTGITTRTLTLANLGYTGATDANNYVHPTGDGNLHVPATSTTNSGKVLTAGATAGSLSWQTPASGVTDHTLLSNIGTNTHAQIDTHIADSTKHFTQAAISITASQVSDFDTEVSNNTTVTGKENSLGNPASNGYVLSSTTAGVRSWIAAGGGGADSIGVTELKPELKYTAISPTLTTVGDAIYTTPGTFSWVCPSGVTSVSVVAVGGGGGGTQYSSVNMGGTGGGLGYKNNITVVPGNSYTVVVGSGGVKGTYGTGSGGNGGDSYFINTTTVKGGGGPGGAFNTAQIAGGDYVGDGGGNGGYAPTVNTYSTGGGGAGGYSGAGGNASSTTYGNGGNGVGGAGGAGGNAGSLDTASGGGGVGLFGEGASGTGGTGSSSDAISGGTGGSGGTDGGIWSTVTIQARGGLYGGGGGSSDTSGDENGAGGDGGLRIVWGSGRSFPSTNVSTSGVSSIYTINWALGIQVAPIVFTTAGSIVFSNIKEGKTITLNVSGSYSITWPTGINAADVADYNGAIANYVQVYCVDETTPKFLVSLKNYPV